MAVMNMLEDVEGETQTLYYSPFELITLGLPVKDYLRGK